MVDQDLIDERKSCFKSQRRLFEKFILWSRSRLEISSPYKSRVKIYNHRVFVRLATELKIYL